jgi:thioredoxin reductase (NADPH)
MNPNSEFLLKSPIKIDDYGHIVVNEKMETSVPGVFSVGDINNKFLRQIVTAAADGSIAAIEAKNYINKNFKK